MLLDKVESIISHNLNIIRHEVEKIPLKQYNYITNIGEISIIDEDKYMYLSTTTQTYLETLSGKLLPYTTFKSQDLYGGKEPLTKKNKEIKFSGVIIGYQNMINYLHLPDFIMTQALKKGIGVKAIMEDVVVEFRNGIADVSLHNNTIFTPYYVFDKEFDYDYETADELAKLIGVFDAYKRNYLFTDQTKALYYLFFPYVSLILYRELMTTLFPLHTKRLVSDVSRKLSKDGIEVLNSFIEKTSSKLKGITKSLKGKTILK